MKDNYFNFHNIFLKTLKIQRTSVFCSKERLFQTKMKKHVIGNIGHR